MFERVALELDWGFMAQSGMPSFGVTEAVDGAGNGGLHLSREGGHQTVRKISSALMVLNTVSTIELS